MTALIYKSHSLIEDLQLGECTIHRCGTPEGKRGWNGFIRDGRWIPA